MEEKTLEVVNAVFGNQMLRELILDFAIHPTGTTICRETLCNIRLAQKCWNLSASDFMRKNKEPLYKLVLDGNNSINGTPYVQEHGKILDEFITFIANRNETFCLYIKPEFFRLENYQSFLAVLHQANTKLVELKMLLPTNGGSLPCMFSNVNLTNLQKAYIQLTKTALDNLENDSAPFQQPINIALLVQSILNRNQSLKILKIEDNRSTNTLTGFQYICLPPTITTLEINYCLLSNQEMELLVRTKLHRLRWLRFTLPNRALPNGLIFGILNNFRTTLEALSIIMSPEYRPIIRNPIKFPIMERLECLEFLSMHYELDPSIVSRLDKCFPRLKTLRCAWQAEEVFRPWIANSNRLEFVAELLLQFVDLAGPSLRRICTTPSADIFQGVKKSMPNVCNLTLYIDSRDALGLRELFKEMVCLESLNIRVHNAEFVSNSDLWDSILTGIPVDIVAGLRTNPSYWKNFKVNMYDKPSIKMLKNLSRLSLNTMSLSDEADTENMEPLISPLSLKFALSTMNSLNFIGLGGRFTVSNEVFEKWWKPPHTRRHKIAYSQDPA